MKTIILGAGIIGISTAWHLLERALARRTLGPYQLKAAIAACHCESDQSDWAQIALLYDRLLAHEPTPVVRLNRAVAHAEAGALDAALADLEDLAPGLQDYQPFFAAQAELLVRKGLHARARAAYERALALAPSEADAAWLASRMQDIAGL